MKKILAILFMMQAFIGLSAHEITRLRTDYQVNPMGIETARPYLSWQIKAAGYGVSQTAYRIVAALSEKDLTDGNYCYDTGKVESSNTVAVPFERTMRPATRYFWKVYVWDGKGRISESEPAWFETGLMNLGWSGARWIGGTKPVLNKYRNDIVVDFDFRSPGGEAEFIFDGSDNANFASVAVDTKAKRFISRITVNGKTTDIDTVDIAKIIGSMPQDAVHHVNLKIDGDISGKVKLVATLDGQSVKEKPENPLQKMLADPRMGKELQKAIDEFGEEMIMSVLFGENASDEFIFNVSGKTDRDAGHIGLIGVGGKAEFINICLSDPKWKVTFSSTERIAVGERELWDPTNSAAPMLRKAVVLDKEIASARLYATARGIYEFEINGEKVGRDYYNPGWPDYNERIYYNSFDVTSMLRQGGNALGITLGAGWYTGFVGMTTDPYGVEPSAMAKLVVDFRDGSRKVVVTDGSWKACSDGPITSNCMQSGQDYDARREIDGWSTYAFDDSSWSNARVMPEPAPTVKIQAYIGETVKNNVTLSAVAMTEPLPGHYIYDMGQNMVGIPRLENIKGRAGQTITLHYAEMLFPEVIPTDPVKPYTIEMYQAKKGQMYTENYREAMSTDHYTLKGAPQGESFEPVLTQHGYRYIEITGLDAPLALEDVKGLVLESIGEQLSWFDSSNPQLNKLFENIVWGQRGNFLSVPTDCPQRNERMGWTGDAQVFCRAATYNMMTDGFYNRWMYAMRDSQGKNGSYANTAPSFNKGGNSLGWMEAGIIVPWQVYQQYGDLRILEDHYDSMIKYMGFLNERAKDHIQPAGLFGDWLAIDNTNTSLTNTAYYAYDARLMAQISRLLGKDKEAAEFDELYNNIKVSWNAKFVDEEGYTRAESDGMAANATADRMGGVMGKAKEKDPLHPDRQDTQTSYVVPLYVDLFNDQNKPLAIRHLVDAIEKTGYTITTGFIGTPYICHVLSNNGHSDVAYKLFEQTAFPSWIFPVLQGATTIWERWNSYTIVNGFGPVDMNSFNHYSYGAIEDWMMSHVLGIERDETQPGYKHFYLRPEVGGTLGFAGGGFESVNGTISSKWDKNANGSWTYKVTIPCNTTATMELASAKVSVRKGKKGILKSSVADGKSLFELAGGEYEFLISSSR